jgi:Na+/proline symporter
LGKIQDPDGVLLRMLAEYSPAWLAGILGAGIISAVMGSDAHQVLAMSTMFTKDIYVHYGGREKYGEKGAVVFARVFIVVVTVIAYLVALYLKSKQGIFEIAIRFAFSGFAAMAPVMVAALFWKRSTKWGACAATVFVGATLVMFAFLQGPPMVPPAATVKPAATIVTTNKPEMPSISDAKLEKVDTSILTVTNSHVDIGIKIAATNGMASAADSKAAPVASAASNIIFKIGNGPDATVILSRAPNGDVRFLGGYMTVVPMVLGSALCMIVFSLLTKPPGTKTIEKYFSADLR